MRNPLMRMTRTILASAALATAGVAPSASAFDFYPQTCECPANPAYAGTTFATNDTGDTNPNEWTVGEGLAQSITLTFGAGQGEGVISALEIDAAWNIDAATTYKWELRPGLEGTSGVMTSGTFVVGPPMLTGSGPLRFDVTNRVEGGVDEFTFVIRRVGPGAGNESALIWAANSAPYTGGAGFRSAGGVLQAGAFDLRMRAIREINSSYPEAPSSCAQPQGVECSTGNGTKEVFYVQVRDRLGAPWAIRCVSGDGAGPTCDTTTLYDSAYTAQCPSTTAAGWSVAYGRTGNSPATPAAVAGDPYSGGMEAFVTGSVPADLILDFGSGNFLAPTPGTSGAGGFLLEFNPQTGEVTDGTRFDPMDAAGYVTGSGVTVHPGQGPTLAGDYTGRFMLGGQLLGAAGGSGAFIAGGLSTGAPWAHSFPGGSRPSVAAITEGLDAGHTLMWGTFTDSIDLGGGTITAAGQGTFLARFDATGAHVWSKGLPEGAIISTTADGVIAVAGRFNGNLNLGGGDLTSEAGGSDDIFLARFGANGAHAWSTALPTAGDAIPVGIAITHAADPNGAGDIILTGFENSVGFARRYSPTGIVKWTRTYSNVRIYEIEAALTGELAVVAYVEGPGTFGNVAPLYRQSALVSGTLNPTNGAVSWVANNNSWTGGAWYPLMHTVEARDVAWIGGDMISTGMIRNRANFGHGALGNPGVGEWNLYLVGFPPTGP